MTDVMIDLETLSTLPNAIILTIGAVKFDRDNEIKSLEESDTFYRRISINSCEDVGLVSSKETLKWWNTQDKSTKYEALNNPERESLQKVLSDFSKWLGKSKKVWGHGDDFDCVILENAYRACRMKTPWQFWDTRDTRTIFDLAKININEIPIQEAHHSLHDAYRQVLGVKNALRKLIFKN